MTLRTQLKKSSQFGFPPEVRLHTRSDYLAFFQSKQSLKLKDLLVFKVPNSFGRFRLGITIKAKVNSVQRNKLKRTTREFFRLHQDQFGSFDYNVVVLGRKQVNHLFIQDFSKELPNILGKI